MVRSLLRVTLACLLVATGWVARAQSSQPDFVIVIDAPVGRTNVRCERGCTLAWAGRGVNPRAVPNGAFEYGCNGDGRRCESGPIGGWLIR